MPTVREAFYEVARRLDLTTIFGNPGSTEETMLREMPDDFRYVLALQEANAVAMADAYSLRTGRPAMLNLHTAAGMGNALGNLETAFVNRAPLIVIAGQQTREMLLHEPYLVNPDPHSIAEPFVKWSYEVVRAADVPAALLRAYATAVQAPAGPVFLSIPMDDFDQDAGALPPMRQIEGRLGADPVLLAPVIAALDASTAPALVVGGAVDSGDGWSQVVRLAERIGAKVWGAPTEGRPGFPETHPAYQGVMPSAIKPAGEALTGCDVVVVLGAPAFRYYPFMPGDVLPADARLFQITDNPRDNATAWIGDAFLADPARACAVLADGVKAAERAPSAKPALAEVGPTGQTITPDQLYGAIAASRPDDSVLVHESLSTMKALKQRITTSRSRSAFSMSSGVLGYGLPAAVGAALAERDLGSNRKVICIVGDGAANYVIQSLWTAAQQKVDVLFVVVRNGKYAILKSFQNYLGTPGVPGLELPQIDFVKLAEGYGLPAQRIADGRSLSTDLAAAFAKAGPMLIEVEVDATIPPLL